MSTKKVMFLSLFVCLSVSNFVQKLERIRMKFSGKGVNGPVNK